MTALEARMERMGAMRPDDENDDDEDEEEEDVV